MSDFKFTIIDPSGDLHLIVSISDEFHSYQVSSTALIASSSIFSSLLSPTFDFQDTTDFRAHPRNFTQFHLKVSVKSGIKFLLPCSILLHLMSGVEPPKYQDPYYADIEFGNHLGLLKRLSDLAALAEYWDCCAAVVGGLDQWFPRGEDLLRILCWKEEGDEFTTKQNCERWLMAAYVLRNERVFAFITNASIRTCYRNVNGTFAVGYHELQVVPLRIRNKIEKKALALRAKLGDVLIRKHLDILTNENSRYCHPDTVKGENLCYHLRYGFIARIMATYGVYSWTTAKLIAPVWRDLQSQIQELESDHESWRKAWGEVGGVDGELHEACFPFAGLYVEYSGLLAGVHLTLAEV